MPRPRGHVAAAVCVLCVAASAVRAHLPQTPEDEAAREAVAALASENWPDRIAASSELMDLTRELDPARALGVLERALTDWLSGGQRGDGDRAEVLARFELAAVEAFFAAPRAGLGITYDSAVTSRGVRLGDTVEGFDAHGTLRGGDIVLSLSDVPIEAQSMDLAVAIASHLPGETCTISLLRNGEPMEVRVRLGRRGDLRAAGQLRESVLRRAWALRMNRLRGGEESAALGAERARAITAAPPSANPRRLRVTMPDVALGGEPGTTTNTYAGVVARFADGNTPEDALQQELRRVQRDLARAFQRSNELEATLRQLLAEVRMTADTADGRAHAERLQKRISELREQLASVQQDQRRLADERSQILRALSQ